MEGTNEIICPPVEETSYSIAFVALTANEVTDWQVTEISFSAEGDDEFDLVKRPPVDWLGRVYLRIDGTKIVDADSLILDTEGPCASDPIHRRRSC